MQLIFFSLFPPKWWKYTGSFMASCWKIYIYIINQPKVHLAASMWFIPRSSEVWKILLLIYKNANYCFTTALWVDKLSPCLTFDAYPSSRWTAPVIIRKWVMAVSMVTPLIFSVVVTRGTIWVKPRAVVFETPIVVFVRPSKWKSPFPRSPSWIWTL